jgi:hypothetical protein
MESFSFGSAKVRFDLYLIQGLSHALEAYLLGPICSSRCYLGQGAVERSMETVETAALARVDKTKAVNWARNGRRLPGLGNGSGQAYRMVSPLPLIKRWRRSVGLSNPTLRESRAPLRLQATLPPSTNHGRLVAWS